MEDAASNVFVEPVISACEHLKGRVTGKEISKHLSADIFRIRAALVKGFQSFDNKASDRHYGEAMFAR